MSDFIIVNNDELYHHGILGQKWGIRRFQNADGSLTEKGKSHYRTNRTLGVIGRGLTNTSLGQRIIGVGINKGYREDRKEIKDLYKEKKSELKNDENLSKEERKQQLESLKNDYKKTKGEARVSAAEALYPWQKTATNEKVQTQNLGKQFLKSFLAGGYGALNYDRLTANDVNRGKSILVGWLTGAADIALRGVPDIVDYAYNGVKYNKKQKDIEK